MLVLQEIVHHDFDFSLLQLVGGISAGIVVADGSLTSLASGSDSPFRNPPVVIISLAAELWKFRPFSSLRKGFFLIDRRRVKPILYYLEAQVGFRRVRPPLLTLSLGLRDAAKLESRYGGKGLP